MKRHCGLRSLLAVSISALSLTALGSGSDSLISRGGGPGASGGRNGGVVAAHRKAAPGVSGASAASAREDWPAIQTGVWDTDCSRTLPNGKTQHWNDIVSQCEDGTELLRGYWGLGLVEQAGCRYEAMRLSTAEFKITSECMVRRAGVAKSEAIVVVREGGTFEMSIKVVEGKKVYRGSQLGHRRSDCPGHASAK